MQQSTGVPVKNLSRPGAQVAEGQDMAGEVIPDDRLVLIEIGGNDLLGGESSVAFEKNLDATLSKLAMPGRTMVMFELPLLPQKIAYRSEEHTSELQSHLNLVCRLLLEKKK